MATVIPDTIDWSAYAAMTEAKIKVKPASSFEAEMVSEFHGAPEAHKPEMFSTKLRGRIEFRPAELTAWAGYNGHRKSMFTGQVALDLIVQRQRTLLASFEMLPARTLGRMVRQAFAAQRPTRDQIERFAKWTDGRLWLFDHVGRIDPSKLLAVMRYFADDLHGAQVFVDSMMMVCGSEESLDEQKQFTTDLVRLAQETGLHIHLIAHCRKPQGGEEHPPSKYDLRGSAAISDQAHNVITVHANKAKARLVEAGKATDATMSEPDQYVTVEKQRNGEWEGRAGLWFDRRCMRFGDSRSENTAPYVLGD